MIQITFILVFVPAYVLSELVPGNNINFITLSGFKYTGEPEVMSEHGVETV